MTKATSLMLVALLVSAAACPAQHLEGWRTYPVDTQVIDRLVAELESGALTRVPEVSFTTGYDKNLVDLVVFFGRGQPPVVQQLVRNGEALRDAWGARTVWVMVFTTDPALIDEEVGTETTVERTTQDKKVTGKETVTTTTTRKTEEFYASAPSIRVEALDYRRGVGEISVIAGIAALFSGVRPTGDAKGGRLEDEDTDLKMTRIGTSTAGKELYFGMVKVLVEENTIYRVRTSLKKKRAYATFGNYSPSRISASVALAFTLADGKNKRPGESRGDFEPYVFFHLYPPGLPRPKLPRADRTHALYPGWPSATVGIKLGDDAFDNIIVGGSLNHMLGSFGSFTGVRYTRVPGKWEWAYAFGLNYSL
ncbi:MAG: hypothetical protein ACE5EO_04845 [Candidatus Krumholzibacteriia bacterium]